MQSLRRLAPSNRGEESEPLVPCKNGIPTGGKAHDYDACL
jgi:hypothetical protein